MYEYVNAPKTFLLSHMFVCPKPPKSTSFPFRATLYPPWQPWRIFRVPEAEGGRREVTEPEPVPAPAPVSVVPRSTWRRRRCLNSYCDLARRKEREGTASRVRTKDYTILHPMGIKLHRQKDSFSDPDYLATVASLRHLPRPSTTQ